MIQHEIFLTNFVTCLFDSSTVTITYRLRNDRSFTKCTDDKRSLVGVRRNFNLMLSYGSIVRYRRILISDGGSKLGRLDSIGN